MVSTTSHKNLQRCSNSQEDAVAYTV